MPPLTDPRAEHRAALQRLQAIERRIVELDLVWWSPRLVALRRARDAAQGRQRAAWRRCHEALARGE